MKNHFLLILIYVLLTFTGCSYTNKNSSQITISKSEADEKTQTKSRFLIEDTEENLISLQNPSTEELNEKNTLLIEDFIQSKIKAFCGETFQLIQTKKDITNKNRDYSNYYIEVNFKISYISEDLVSVIFEGFLNKKETAHPYHLFFDFNFNPKTSKPVAFSERYFIDDALYDAFSQQAEKNILEQCDGQWPSGWKSFSEQLCPKDKFLEGIEKEETFYWYHTQNGVGFSYPVVFALGDHMEVELPYEALKAK